MPARSLSIAMLLALPLSGIAAGETFVVAERPGSEFRGDSYILELTDPEDIAHARDLIEFGPEIGAPIIFARIAAGSDGINRDVLADGEPLYSWHVESFDSFVDISAEIYDGWPTYIEEDVPRWFDNTEGYIGFWNYTVVAELQAVCPGDCDDSGEVDFNDLVAILFEFGESNQACDTDASGAIDFNDLVATLFLFGPCA